MSKLAGPVAVFLLIAVGAASVAYASYVEGTEGDDDVVVQRSGAVAYLKGGNDTFTGAPGKRGGGDHVYGGTGADEIVGRTFTDMLRGQDGGDTLDGGGHRDGLYGGPGADTLIGGAGVDLFRPGKGEDTCIGQLEDYGFPARCERVEIEE